MAPPSLINVMKYATDRPANFISSRNIERSKSRVLYETLKRQRLEMEPDSSKKGLIGDKM